MVGAISRDKDPGNGGPDRAPGLGQEVTVLIKRNETLEGARVGYVPDCDKDSLARNLAFFARFQVLDRNGPGLAFLVGQHLPDGRVPQGNDLIVGTIDFYVGDLHKFLRL